MIDLNSLKYKRAQVLYVISFFIATSLFAPIKYANVLSLILGVLWLISIRDVQLQFKPFVVLMILVFSYYAVEFLSLFYSENSKAVWLRLENHSALIAIPILFTVFTCIDFNRLLKWFTSGLIAGSVIIGTKFLIDYYHNYSSGFLDLTVDTPFSEILYLHPTYMSLFLSTSILLSVRLNHKKIYLKVLLIVYIIYIIIIVILLSSKLGLLFLAVSVPYFFYNMFPLKNHYWRYALLTIVIACLAGLVNKNEVLINRFRSIYTDPFKRDPVKGFNTFSGRIMFWRCSIGIISNNPILGVGVGDAQHHLDECYVRYEPTTNSPDFLGRFNTHNQFLQTSIETGLIGLCILILFFIVTARNSIDSGYTELLLSCLLLFIFFLFESALLRNKGLSYFAIIISLSTLACANHSKTFKVMN
jgi:O-antigen ligase